jgi:hypothetical protein
MYKMDIRSKVDILKKASDIFKKKESSNINKINPLFHYFPLIIFEFKVKGRRNLKYPILNRVIQFFACPNLSYL